MNYMKLYEENADFKLYVDRYMKTYGVSLETALCHKLVQEVGNMYNGISENRIAEQGNRQKVRHGILVPTFVGSNPTSLAKGGGCTMG